MHGARFPSGSFREYFARPLIQIVEKFSVGAVHRPNASPCTSQSTTAPPIHDGGTQWMSVSAAIDNRTICSAKCGTQSITQPRREDISREWWHGKKNHSRVGRCRCSSCAGPSHSITATTSSATDDLFPNIPLKNLSRALVGARRQILHDRWSNHRAIIVCMLEQCLRITSDAASTREAPLTSQNRAVHSL